MRIRHTMLYAAAAMALVAAIATPDIASANAPTMSAHASATPVFESFHATVPEDASEFRVYQAPQLDAIPRPLPAIFATLFVFALIVGLVFYSIRAEIERQRSFGANGPFRSRLRSAVSIAAVTIFRASPGARLSRYEAE